MTMKTISKKHTGVKVAAAIKAGGMNLNHSRTLSVKSGIKAGEGILAVNHNRRAAKGVKVAAAIKAGGMNLNHSRTLSVKSGIKAGEGILAVNHNRRAA
jgi:hypothetical protein